jgi:hypothetical protein
VNTHEKKMTAQIASILTRSPSEARTEPRKNRRIDHMPTLNISDMAKTPMYGNEEDESSGDQEEDEEDVPFEKQPENNHQSIEMIEQIEAIQQLQAKLCPTVQSDGEYIIFALTLPTRRPHLTLKFHPEGTKETHLLDSGSFFSLCSRDKLTQIEELWPQKFVLEPSNIRLQSHSEHPVAVLGTTNIPIYVEDQEKKERVFTIMPFLITNDSGKCLLGTSFESSRLGMVKYAIVNRELTATLSIDKHIVENEMKHQDMIKNLSTLPTPIRDQKSYRVLVKTTQQFHPGVATSTTCTIQPESWMDISQLINTQVIISMEIDSFCSSLDYLVDINKNLEITVPLTNKDKLPLQLNEDVCIGRATSFLPDPGKDHGLHDFVATILQAPNLPFVTKDKCYCQDMKKDCVQIYFSDHLGRTEFPFVTASASTKVHSFIKTHLLAGSPRTGYTLFIRNGRLKPKKIKEILMSLQGRPRITFVIPPERLLKVTETATISMINELSQEMNQDFQAVSYQKNCKDHHRLDFPITKAILTIFRFENAHKQYQTWSRKPNVTFTMAFLGGTVMVNSFSKGNTFEVRLPDNYRCNPQAAEAYVRQFLHAVWITNPDAKMSILMPDHLSNFALEEALSNEVVLAKTGLQTAKQILDTIELQPPQGMIEVCISNSQKQLYVSQIEFDSTVEPWFHAINSIEETFKDVPEIIPNLYTKRGLKQALKAGDTYKDTPEFNQFLKDHQEPWNEQEYPSGARDEVSMASDMDESIPNEACLPEIPGAARAKELPTHWSQLPSPFPDSMTQEAKTYYTKLFNRHQHEISLYKGHTRPWKGVPPLHLDIGDATHCLMRDYPLNPALRKVAFAILDQLITTGVCFEVNSSPFSSPMFIIPRTRKTNEMTPEERKRRAEEDPTSLYRIVVNFSGVNSLLQKRDSEIGDMQDIFSSMQGQSVGSLFDLSSFFHCLELSKKAQIICTMGIAGRLIRPKRCMEGISANPAHAAHIINLVRKRSRLTSFAYLDDIIISAPDKETLRERSELLMKDFEDCGALISLAKCQLERTTLDILGHTVVFGEDKVTTIIPQTARFKIFKEYPPITTVSSLMRFLGLLAYVQSFGKNLAFIASPLYAVLSRHNLLPKNQQVVFTPTEQRSFDILCQKMACLESQVIIGAGASLNLYVDASYFGFGCVVTANYQGKERICSYYSKKFTESFTRNNSSGSKEVMATLQVANKFRKHILQASEVTIHSDCSVLLSLMLRCHSGKALGYAIQQRWLHVLGSYPLKFKHLPRTELQHADALSKIYASTPNHDHLVESSLKTLKPHQVAHEVQIGKVYAMADFSRKIEEKGVEMIAQHEEDCQGCKSPPPGARKCPDKECLEISKEELEMEEETVTIEDLKYWVPACQILHNEENPQDIPVQVNAFSPQPLLGYDIATILDIQEADQDCSYIIRILQTVQHPPRSYSRYRLLHNLMLMRLKSKNEPPVLKNLQIILPRPEVTKLLFNLHLITHCPSEKLWQLVTRHFYHPQMRQLTKAIANSCPTCLVWKRQQNTDLPEGALPPPKRPLQMVYLDFAFMHPVYVNHKRFKYLLLFIDSFSLLTWGVACQNMEITTVEEVFRGVLPHLLQTQYLISDNQNTLLCAEAIKNLIQENGIRPVTTMPYSSSSNLGEIAVKLTRAGLRILQARNGRNWVNNLVGAFGLINSIHHTHGALPRKSPYEIVHNLPTMTGPLQDELDNHNENEQDVAEVREGLEEIKRLRYEGIQARIQARIAQAQLKKGSLVVLLKHGKERKSKMETYYHEELYVVRDRLNHKLLISPCDNLDRTFRVHISKVKLVRRCPRSVYQELDPDQQIKLGPTAVESDSSDQADSDTSNEQDDPQDSSGPDNDDDHGSDLRPRAQTSSPARTLPGNSNLVSGNPQADPEEASDASQGQVTPMPSVAWRTRSSRKSTSKAVRAGRSLRKMLSRMGSSMKKALFTPGSSSGRAEAGSHSPAEEPRSMRSKTLEEEDQEVHQEGQNEENVSVSGSHHSNTGSSSSSSSSSTDSRAPPRQGPTEPVMPRRSGRQRGPAFDFKVYNQHGRKEPKK